MIITTKESKQIIQIVGKVLKQVKRWNYLETIMEEKGTIDKEIHERTGKTGKIHDALKSTFLER